MDTLALPICGIIMPISAIEPNYPETHWVKVRKILERAITRAEMLPRAVWENQNNDIIHGKILKNIYENDVVVCDCSGRNPNVMLEIGMRLTTKKPTVLICDKSTSLPFDTSIISHCMYSSDLEYNETDEFIESLSKAIKTAHSASLDNSYVSFVENFHFETVTPSTVTISADQFQSQKIEDILLSIQRLDDKITRISSASPLSGALRKYDNGTTTPASDLLSIALARKARADLSLGQRVFHQKFGEGAILEIEGNKLEIMFDSAGQKRCMDSFVTIVESHSDD